jgi:hypothetical protein
LNTPQVSGIDAKWSNHGVYLQHMLERVVARWRATVARRQIPASARGSVTITFVLDADGEVSRIADVRSDSGSDEVIACLVGIRDGAPYGTWPKPMREQLGERQSMTFKFKY